MRCSEPPLWLTFPGAGKALGAGWLAWLVGATALGWWMDGMGAALEVAVLLVGRLLAGRFPEPTACLRRFHLDDAELVILGPGRRVRRVPWDRLETLAQDRHVLELGARQRVRIPLVALRWAGAWTAVLVKAVPHVAQCLWARLERGTVRLRPDLAPRTGPLVWWALVPAVAALAAGGEGGDWLVVCAAAGMERGMAWLAASAREIQVESRGVLLGMPRRELVAWPELSVQHSRHGIGLARRGHPPHLVPETLRDYWAVAPVLECRARLGTAREAEVCFRARADGGALAVIGEIDALP